MGCAEVISLPEVRASTQWQRLRNELHARFEGIGLTRDSVASVRYAEGLNSSKSSVPLRSTDRHDILGQKSSGFQLSL
jgi:hypothetical protein